MIGYEPKVKKQTTATLIDINRVYLQVFMGFGFLAFMPGQWVWETPLCSGVDLSHESQYNYIIFYYLNQNFRSGDSSPIF